MKDTAIRNIMDIEYGADVENSSFDHRQSKIEKIPQPQRSEGIEEPLELSQSDNQEH